MARIISGDEEDFNDGLFIPRCEPKTHTFIGEQRRRIVQTIDASSPNKEHIDLAAQMVSPLLMETPIAADFSEVLDLIDHNVTALIARFWDSQLADFEVLVGKSLTLT